MRTTERKSPVREARREKGLTQDELADLCRCGQATISMIELGQVKPSLSLAQRLCEVLDKTLDDLFAEAR